MPSFASLRTQTSTFPHSYRRNLGQRIKHPFRNPPITQEPATLSLLAESNPRYDRTPSGIRPALLGQSGYVKDTLAQNKGGRLLAQRSDDGSR
jgi:hypothetical protein